MERVTKDAKDLRKQIPCEKKNNPTHQSINNNNKKWQKKRKQTKISRNGKEKQ